MNAEQQAAFEWAKNQNFQSVAARYAKTLAGLIESLQAEVTKWKERHNQAALNFQQENRENAKLQAQLSASQRREKAVRNELCLKCGLYHDAHNGACDGCRWKGEAE